MERPGTRSGVQLTDGFPAMKTTVRIADVRLRVCDKDCGGGVSRWGDRHYGDSVPDDSPDQADRRH